MSDDVVRMVYLDGGLIALSNPGLPVGISAALNAPVFATVTIRNVADLFGALATAGFTVLGRAAYDGPDEVSGTWPAEFRVLTPHRGWQVEATTRRWREVAVHAASRDDMALSDVAARIAFELAAAEVRLQGLADAYGRQLRGRCQEHPSIEYARFDDRNSRAVVLAIHALFGELAVLRDVLAEFVAAYVVLTRTSGDAPIRTLAGLLKGWKSLPVADSLAEQIRAAASDDRAAPGWLAELGAYRDIFTHASPLPYVGRRLLTILEPLTLANGIRVPRLYWPLPPTPIALRQDRSRGFPFDTFRAWVDASVGHRPDRSREPDALQYLHGALCQLAELATAVLSRSPLPPQPIQLGPADFIGGATVVQRAPLSS